MCVCVCVVLRCVVCVGCIVVCWFGVVWCGMCASVRAAVLCVPDLFV